MEFGGDATRQARQVGFVFERQVGLQLQASWQQQVTVGWTVHYVSIVVNAPLLTLRWLLRLGDQTKVCNLTGQR
jgi:hypothetical protein